MPQGRYSHIQVSGFRYVSYERKYVTGFIYLRVVQNRAPSCYTVTCTHIHTRRKESDDLRIIISGIWTRIYKYRKVASNDSENVASLNERIISVTSTGD